MGALAVEDGSSSSSTAAPPDAPLVVDASDAAHLSYDSEEHGIDLENEEKFEEDEGGYEDHLGDEAIEEGEEGEEDEDSSQYAGYGYAGYRGRGGKGKGRGRGQPPPYSGTNISPAQAGRATALEGGRGRGRGRGAVRGGRGANKHPQTRYVPTNVPHVSQIPGFKQPLPGGYKPYQYGQYQNFTYPAGSPAPGFSTPPPHSPNSNQPTGAPLPGGPAPTTPPPPATGGASPSPLIPPVSSPQFHPKNGHLPTGGEMFSTLSVCRSYAKTGYCPSPATCIYHHPVHWPPSSPGPNFAMPPSPHLPHAQHPIDPAIQQLGFAGVDYQYSHAQYPPAQHHPHFPQQQFFHPQAPPSQPLMMGQTFAGSPQQIRSPTLAYQPYPPGPGVPMYGNYPSPSPQFRGPHGHLLQGPPYPEPSEHIPLEEEDIEGIYPPVCRHSLCLLTKQRFIE